MSGTVPGRMRRRLAFALLVALVSAGVVVSTAAAIAFTDDSCANDSTCRPPTGLVGSSYLHTVQVRPGGGTAPYTYTVSSGALPPGLSLNSSSGAITGTASASGTYTFYLDGGDACPDAASCIDESGQYGPNPDPVTGACDNANTVIIGGTCRFPHAAAQREFTIVVNPGLRILTNSLPQGATVGVPYSVTLQTQLLTNLNPPTGTTPGPLTWSIIPGSGSLPPGLTLANGVISGSPTTEGTYQFQVQAELDASRKHFQTYSLTVRQPLKIAASKPFATVPLPTLWEVGVPFSARLTPSGGSGTYTFALSAGSLPTGLALAANGSVVGTTRAAGVYRATIRLSDTEGRTTDYAANFGVAARLAVSTLALRPGKVGRLYRGKVASTGGVLPRKWKILKGPLPKGVRFDPARGILSGTPTKAGRYRVTFQVTDGLKVVAKKTLRIDILDA